MIKFKAWNASNSRAIAKFHNAEIGDFGHNAFIHELIRGSLIRLSHLFLAIFLSCNERDRIMHYCQRGRGDADDFCQQLARWQSVSLIPGLKEY